MVSTESMNEILDYIQKKNMPVTFFDISKDTRKNHYTIKESLRNLCKEEKIRKLKIKKNTGHHRDAWVINDLRSD